MVTFVLTNALLMLLWWSRMSRFFIVFATSATVIKRHFNYICIQWITSTSTYIRIMCYITCYQQVVGGLRQTVLKVSYRAIFFLRPCLMHLVYEKYIDRYLCFCYRWNWRKYTWIFFLISIVSCYILCMIYSYCSVRLFWFNAFQYTLSDSRYIDWKIMLINIYLLIRAKLLLSCVTAENSI